MRNFQHFSNVMASNAEAGGQKVRIRDFVVVQIIENAPVLCLVLFIVVFAGAAIYLNQSERGGELQKWMQNLTILCLGVFLGMFKGKKV